MKKLLLWVCTLILFLSAVATAGADLVYLDDENSGNGIYIYYIPATKDSNEITTAKYIAQSIIARRPDVTANIGKYNGKAFSKISEIFSNGNSDGTGTINKRLIPAQPEIQANDYWFIIPEEAANQFINNSELMDQCRSLLTNESSRAHVVLIVNHAISIPAESALGTLGAEGKTDWIQIHSDFSATELSSNSYEDRDIHTGNYFMAALSGKPADLPYTVSEDGSTRTFTMPEAGKAFIVVHWKQEAPGIAECMDSAGNPCEKKDMEITLPKEAAYTGTLLTKLAGGNEYTVACQNGEVDSFNIYWYPNLTEIKPEVLQEGNWTRGENEIKLTVANDLGRPEDFNVLFDYQVNDGAAAQVYAEYNPEQKLWSKTITADTNTQTVSVIPSARLNMKDGNKIWEWNGEEVVFDVLSEGVRKSSQAPPSLTLWYDPVKKNYGETSLAWSDVFTYNPEDQPEFDCRSNNEACILCSKTENSFTITVKEGEDSVDPWTVTLSATLLNEKAIHTIVIERVDVAEIWKEFKINLDKEGKEVPVGKNGEIRISAYIPPEAIAKLQEAIAQKVIPFTPKYLFVNYISPYSSATIPFESDEDDEGMKAEAEIFTPDNAPPGTYTVHADISAHIDTEPDVLTERDIDYIIINTPPELTLPEALDDEVRMDGLPWAYNPIDNLLVKVFGTDKLFDLFKDPETDLVSAYVRVENAQHQELFSETVHNPEDITEIVIKEPGEYQIVLVANDGANDSQHVQKVKVYSFVMRIVSYVVAGLLAVLLILAIVLIIIQVRKPSFEGISIRAFISSDENQDTADEILSKCKPVPLDKFKKKKITLATVLVLCRQPELSGENMAVAEDISLLTTKDSEICILFGKEAQKLVGRSEKKDILPRGKTHRFRMGNTYIQIENVQL